MSEYKKVVLSTNYTSQRNAASSDPPDQNSISYERREVTSNFIQPGVVKQASSRIITDTYQNGHSESRYTVSQRRINSNEAVANVRTSLEWQGEKQLVLSGETEFSTLKHTKELLLNLLGEFNRKQKVVFEGDYKQDFSKRLLLLEHELEGTMRRVLSLSQTDPSGGKRSLDYLKLIGQKENALIDKERKIGNYEERLRVAEERVVSLEIEIQGLNGVIGQRNAQIQQLRRQLEVRSNAIDKIRGQPSFANSQELREILRVLRSEEEGNAQNAVIKTQLSQLEREINKLKSRQCSLQDLDTGIESWILGLPGQSALRNKVSLGQTRLKEDERLRSIQEKFNIAAELYRQQLDRLQRENPSIRIAPDTQILDLLRSSSSRVNISGGVVQIEKEVKVTTQVPVQDSRTRYLIGALASHVRRINEKYPKLKGELDIKLQQLLSGELTDVVEGDSLDRIVDIVRYVPQMVKVENVYTYSSQRSRKVEFHLRVLIKALLQQMQKVKREKGMVFEIDEGVIGMIRAEIMDIVDVDDILKVYRAVPKIVEVPKIVQKVVDNIVRVPQKYTLNQLQSEVVSLQKPQIAVDEKALIVQSHQPVPLYRQKAVQLISHTEKVVSHPQKNERVAIEVREKTKLQAEEVQVQRIVEVEKAVMVQVQKIVIQREIQPVQVIKQVVRYMETEKEVPKPIEVIVQKIVEKVIEREKIVTVPIIKEKIVEVVRYEKVKEFMPHIQTRIQIVKQIQEKIVPVYHTEQVIVTVPQIVQKIVTVQKVVQLPPKEIQVIREVLRIVKEIQIVEIEVPKIIYETRVEIRQVEKYIQVPIIVPQTRIETEIHQIPFVETIQMEKHIPVQVIKHVILTEEKPVQVIKNVPFIMKEEVPVLVREQKIIPHEIYMQRIKEVPTTKEKIIQKIVEVPRCVEIQKIVEKIVIVPRIIEKIVLVPQIIEKIVEKIVQIPIQMPPVQHYIPQNLFIEKPVQIDTQRIVYLNVDRAVQVPGDQILVKDLETRTSIQVQKVIEERVVIERQQVPVTIHVDKIVTVPVQKRDVQFVDRVIFRPIEVPVPVNIERTLPVYINTETVKVQPVTQVVQKIVEKERVMMEARIIPQVKEKVIVEERVQFREVAKPYIEKQIMEVQRFEEKIVAISTTIDKIKEVPYFIEKLVPVIQEIPKIYEYEKEPKVVFTPPSIEIVDRIVPKIINVNKYIQKIVEKLVQVPHLMRQIEVVKQTHERNIPGPIKTSTALKTVNLQVEKELIRQKEKVIETRVNFIEETLRTVTQIMERERDPVIITQDRIIEVPHVLEKIVEKVVVMPQIVEVLKYVHELVDGDGDLGVDLSIDVSVQAQEYKKLGEDLQRGFSDFIAELNKVKSMQPSAAQRIAMIESYLAKFRRFIKYPKIHEIIKEKVVDKVVRVPHVKGPAQIKEQLAKVLLIQKLVGEISRIKRSHPQISLELQEDINFIFRLNFEGKVRDVNSKLTAQLKQFQNSLDRKFSKMGGWSKDHQLMLKSFLQERFVLANIVKTANDEIKVSRKQNQQLSTENARVNSMLQMLFKALLENKQMMPGILGVLGRDRGDNGLAMAYSLLINRFDEVIDRYNSYQREDFEPTRYLGRRVIEEMVGSALREKEKEIELLKQKLRSGRAREGDHAQCNAIIQGLQNDLQRAGTQMTQSSINGKDIQQLQQQIQRLNKLLKETSSPTSKTQEVRSLETEIARLKVLVNQDSDHSNCTNVQRGLEAENRRLKGELDALLIRYRNLEQELILLRNQSPRKTVVTSLGGREKEEGKRSIVISHVDRESQAQDYGQNYQEYVNGDINAGGTVEYQAYRSGIVQQRDLANSAATYRSGQVITSSQYVRGPTTTTNIESARYLTDREGREYSTSTAGVSGVKKYNYYQKRYEGNT